ncbi:MAG: PSD1 and planctomycete cytochrome C domain-containing protein [Akkermansiaceae bacterium]
MDWKIYIKLLTLLTALIGLISCEKNQRSSQSESRPAEKTTPKSSVETVSFNEHIQPILSESCYHCHGPDEGSREPGGKISDYDGEPLRVDKEKYAFEKRKNGKHVIIPGDPDNSLLMQLMESHNPDLVMPLHPSRSPHGSIIAPEKIALVRQWIKEGAKYEPHWAYIPPKKHPLPEVAHADWAKNNPIDRFIAARFESAGLAPNPKEKPTRLIRRLYFDLTGLPPTPEDLEKTLSDTRDFDTVYLETVNRLLKTDAYAEHWTRHWLDVARYADTHGYQLDNYRSVWPYRDWVINAFNSNMPFDQFTREQIAGDMMPNPKIEQVIATGFNRCLPTNGEAGSIEEEYHVIYAQERLNTTSTVWLGLTAGCAACHDHKFDAISMKENYQLTAFFRNTPMTALDKHAPDHPPNVRIMTDADKARSEILNPQISQLEKELTEHRKKSKEAFKKWHDDNRNDPKLLVGKDIKPIRKLLKAASPTSRQLTQLRDYYFTKIDAKGTELTQKLTPLRKELKDIHSRSPTTLVMQENKGKEAFAHTLQRGDYTARLDRVTADTPAMLPTMGDLPKNRLGLAKWLTAPENPLPARVTVNRYWYYIFGEGIVSTTGDFGVVGARPTHPKLLDWLATDFVENGWDLHHLLRTIVTSATYRQSSNISKEKQEIDAPNKWLARAPRYRLDAEQIRDMALQTSGLLHQKIGGKPVKPYQPEGIWSVISMKKSNTGLYKPGSGEDLYRRSLYTFWKRTAAPPSMEIFNAPDRTTSCVKREITNTPLQAFVLMNDIQFVEASRNIAERAMQSADTPEQIINCIARLLISRSMRESEIRVVHSTYQDALKEFTTKPEDAKKLINVGESVPDSSLPAEQLAAWTIVANQILNMDETLNK